MQQLPGGQDAATASFKSRQLLSQLSTSAGIFLEPANWSKRGTGRPQHPDMPAGWHASISHRQGRVVAALANCPIGIDLEFWQARHTTRLNDLIELLPEPAIQQQIRQSGDPQRSFYKAYTLHEALYKLASANGQPVEGLFQTRIADIQPLGKHFAWQWEDPQWSLSIVASEDVSMELPLMARHHQIALKLDRISCHLSEQLAQLPALRSLRVEPTCPHG
ncbi:4-phosphopantetheinyl transferase [Granulosicoccus antarcticus]|uniref:4'-phosphopantetheinyl transferase domain-containing protein n=1 Tax=Granulosicoccus antarcticus IMCC3135 TaxID=1192854 RepID=A0A2Z2PAH1_9GAMM|nr:4-phosphopantetheinyl transferase [Granulosicoccus antarcticus]ASJ76864.1 hypothetical protein IMCC3135_34120 [Granulosicoccus antarcticus IMCC3135]